MPHMKKMSLKAFWEAVEQQLTAYSAAELRAILRTMAQETLPAERQTFLDKLKPGEETAAIVEQALGQEELLADIDDLVHEIKAEMEHAEYWEERRGWHDDYYDDEDSLGPYEEFVEPLAALFDRTEAAFDYGNLTLARAAYQKLFEEALEREDDYGRRVSASDLSNDMGEVRARYLRAVYETELPARRPDALFGQLQRVQSWLFGPRPMLDDVIQISPRPLPDHDRFLEDWIAFLRKQSGGDADTWLREAIRILQGTPGLEELARVEGTQRPRAYLDWFIALEREGKHREVLAAAQESLQTLPAGLPIRAAVADHLCAAAAKLNEPEALRAGRWEAFVAKPALVRLLDLWEAAPAGEERTSLMGQAARHVQDYLAHPPHRETGAGGDAGGYPGDGLESPARIDDSVLAHAHLLAVEWEAVHQLALPQKVLGWTSSSSSQGLVLSSFLTLLSVSSGKLPDALPPNLAGLWKRTLQNSLGYGAWRFAKEGEGDSPLERLERIYTERLPEASLSTEQQEEYLSWCLDVAGQRVDAIVGNQKRRSYDKAAELITACAETLRLRGKDREAAATLDEVRNRFPRHRAFHRELNAAVQKMERDLGQS